MVYHMLSALYPVQTSHVLTVVLFNCIFQVTTVCLSHATRNWLVINFRVHPAWRPSCGLLILTYVRRVPAPSISKMVCYHVSISGSMYHRQCLFLPDPSWFSSFSHFSLLSEPAPPRTQLKSFWYPLLDQKTRIEWPIRYVVLHFELISTIHFSPQWAHCLSGVLSGRLRRLCI